MAMHSAERLRSVGCVVVVALVWSVVTRHGDRVDPKAPSQEAALAGVLSARGLACDPDDVVWLDAPGGRHGLLASTARALVRAHASGEPSDLFLVEARVSPEGALVEVGDSWNLTDTSGVDESRPILRERVAAYVASADGLVTGAHLLDLAGHPADAYTDFTRVQRVQVALTNLQQTGQTAGISHCAFVFDPVARSTSLVWRPDGSLEVHADDRLVVLDPKAIAAADADGAVVAGSRFVRVVPDQHARPGNVVTWAVDRVRAMSWFGDDRMQWVKAVAFTALDKLRATFAPETTPEDVRDELGLSTASATSNPATPDPEIGWPPAPLKVIASSPIPGEGQWIALDKDPFITPASNGAAPPFVTSFIRPDPRRPDVRVYITLWDPRLVAMHMEAGTVEPISGTGAHGPGLIPRTPEVMDRVVAAFNGGFQAQHGEYGMAAGGIEYLPPKPYAATVVEFRDGSNGFGSWPSEGPAPPDVIALRQNLTALVQDGKFNPWGRTWWGGAPPGWPDQIHSTRSAICLTEEGFAGYFYSPSIAADDLARGMIAARCSFGIHLDMNPGHAGFEFYRMAPQGSLPPLGRPLQSDWEAEGKVPSMPGYAFRARRMIRGMGHMLFPRYVQREARDFFYLTWRPILPGAPVPPGGSPVEGGEGVWRVRGLPQQGFPPALATTWARIDPRRPELTAHILRADPRMVHPAESSSAQAPLVLALVAPIYGETTLWWDGDAFSITPGPPSAEATAIAAGFAAPNARAAGARVAVGVQDADGMLLWVELPVDAPTDATSVGALDGLLARLGCSARMFLPAGTRAMPGGSLDVSGDPIANPPPVTVRLMRSPAPGARPIFPDTPIVPLRVWQPIQAKRVRYFLRPASSSAPAADPHGP